MTYDYCINSVEVGGTNTNYIVKLKFNNSNLFTEGSYIAEVPHSF